MRNFVAYSLICLVFFLLETGTVSAQLERAGANASGLCGLVHVGSPRCAPGWTLSGTSGYGATRLHGLHHRAIGTLGVAYVPLEWLALSVELAGRMDVHPADEHGAKHLSATGDPWVHGRVGWLVAKGVSLGGELGLWLPGNTAPSYSPKATTVDVKGLLSWMDSSAAWTVLGQVGVRVDNSANAAPDPARLRYGDRIALGLSEFHALLVGLGAARAIGPVQIFGEVSAQLLLGSHAPPLSASPLRVAVGGRYFFSHGLSAELSVIPLLSTRPNTGPDDPLVPIEPRLSVLAGLRYQRLAKKPSAEPVKPVEPVATEPADEPEKLAALRGVLTDQAGEPLPDATILLNDAAGQRESVTQADGSYLFTDLKPGRVTLSVTTPGFQPSMWEVEVVAPLTHAAPHQLVPAAATGSLRCFVRSFKSEPLAADIVVRDTRGRRVAAGKTNPEGLWELPLAPGEYRVTIEAQGHESRRSNVRVAPNEVAVLNIDLREAR